MTKECSKSEPIFAHGRVAGTSSRTSSRFHRLGNLPSQASTHRHQCASSTTPSRRRCERRRRIAEGLATCGKCGRRLHTHYRARNTAPGYHRSGKDIVHQGRGVYCLNVGDVQIDQAVVDAVLNPLRLAALKTTQLAIQQFEADHVGALGAAFFSNSEKWPEWISSSRLRHSARPTWVIVNDSSPV